MTPLTVEQFRRELFDTFDILEAHYPTSNPVSHAMARQQMADVLCELYKRALHLAEPAR